MDLWLLSASEKTDTVSRGEGVGEPILKLACFVAFLKDFVMGEVISLIRVCDLNSRAKRRLNWLGVDCSLGETTSTCIREAL